MLSATEVTDVMKPRGLRRAVLGLLTLVLLAPMAAVLAPASPAAAAGRLYVAPLAGETLSGGGQHACAIATDGQLQCWGAGDYGQLGTGAAGADQLAPVSVTPSTGWTSVSAGGGHTCGLRGTDLFCWGTNHHGQVGDTSRTRRPAPVEIGTSSEWLQVSASWYHSCAVRTDRTAACWGHNQWGQLGAGGTRTRAYPVDVQGAGWASVSAGGWHSCGIKADRSLWCWGRNDFGQLGDGTYTVRNTPVRVGTASDWTHVEASWTHTCGVRAGSQVMCWGRNDQGQVGDGSLADRVTPTAVPIAGGASRVTAGIAHTCALREADGYLTCWGNNTHGTLGNGTRAMSASPHPVAGSYREVDAGWLSTCAAERDGALACWGNNERGQLADGSRIDRASTSLRPVASVEQPVQADRRRKRRALSFGLATYNILGDPHTVPGGDADHLPPARIRAEWTAAWMTSQNISVFGLQEANWSQVQALQKATGSRYEMWPGLAPGIPGGVKQSLVWDRSAWKAMERRLIRVPFLRGQTRQLPVVRLRKIGTRRDIWVMNVHNAPNHHQQARNIAVRREIREIKRHWGVPIFAIGDFNEKRTVFCKIVGNTRLVSASGGWANKRGCRPPSFMRVDWIFGPRRTMTPLQWLRPPAVAVTTDHHVGVVQVRIP